MEDRRNEKMEHMDEYAARSEEETPEISAEAKEAYVPRNAIVAAKESLYDKTNLTVGQVDKFIIGCIAAIIVLVIFGLMH